MEPVGYPVYFLYLILLIGIPLSLFRPFKAFLMVVFLTAAANADAFTFTRTPLLGPYFNANDACLLIVLLAIVSDKVMPKVAGKYNIKNKKIIMGPAKWIILVLLIGFVQSCFVMGWTYDVLRALRWAITLPVYFIIAATMVDKKDKVRPLLLTLFLGSLVSVFEHFFYVQSRMSLYQLSAGDIGQFRTIAFRSPGLWLLLAGLVWLPETKILKRPVLIGAGILFAVSTILNQTRSIWMSSIAVLPVTFLLFRQKKIIEKAIVLPFVLLVLYGGISLAMHYVTPNISPGDIIMPRFKILFQGDMINENTLSRRLDFQLEMEKWSQGTLILGRGLSYFAPYYMIPYRGNRVAWGHLGHVSTLAQLGLIGFFVYSIYLPFIIIQASRKIWIEASDEVKFLGLFAGLTMIWFWICFFMSDSFLGQHAAAGIIFGAAWRQAMLLKTDKAAERKSQPAGILRRFVPRRIVW